VQHLLQLQSSFGLTQAAVEYVVYVVSETRQLIDTSVKISHIPSPDVQADTASHHAVMPVIDPFIGTDSEWLRKKFYRENFGLIEPVEVVMAERLVAKHGHVFKRVSAVGYIVPFLTAVKQLVEMPEVQKLLIENEHFVDGSMKDINDGLYCKGHPLFSRPCLRIMGYYDDIEVVNPIGVSTKKHKLSVFLWMLLNIPPKLRSQLSNIQLLAVAKVKDCKEFGLSQLLHDFVSSLQTLADNGIEVCIGGRTETLFGGLVAFVGDTPAANLIGGFKEGVGFARKICRTCEANKDQTSILLTDSNCILRDDAEHQRRCSLLESSLTAHAKKYWSKVYGINKSSVLMPVSHFSVTQCFLHDPMHVLFEGVTAMEMKLLLKYLVNCRQYFTIFTLAGCLRELASELPSDCRPNPIDSGNLQSPDEKLKQTAHQTWWLSNMLPLAVGDYIASNDAKWINFLRVLQIQQLCMSPVADNGTVSSLRILVARHNSSFDELYPECHVTPKMHYLLHFPEQIRNFGPARNHWAMRFEAKHGFFKRKKMRCTKNVPLSLASEHQMWMCCQQHDDKGCKSTHYLRQPSVSSGGEYVGLTSFIHGSRISSYLGLTAEESCLGRVLFVSELIVAGIRYRLKDVILTAYGDEKVFAYIDNLAVIREKHLGIVSHCLTEYFDCHKNCYIISRTSDISVLDLEMLAIPWPVLCVQQKQW